MSSEIAKSIQYLCDEKDLEYTVVLEALEAALAAAYRKDFGSRQGNYTVNFDVETGDMKVWDVKIVVADIEAEALEQAQEELTARREKAREENRELTDEDTADLPQFNPKIEMMLSEAAAIKADAKVGDELRIPQEVPSEFGRMAAMTAKQVIIQKIREAERTNVFEDFKEQQGRMVQGIIQKRDRNGSVIVDLGKISGVVPPEDQIRRETYRPGARMRFYVSAVEMGPRGPMITLSRSTSDMVQSICEQEVPEIAEGSVVIKKIARDAGNRSKIAVFTDDDTIDPIGACIGQRGSRITTIIEELGGEKIDVIQWSDDPVVFIKHALSPAKVDRVELDEEKKEATVHVPAEQFSLAIGRGGVNVRLASQLTGWKLNAEQVGGEAVKVGEEAGEVEEQVEAENAGEPLSDEEHTPEAPAVEEMPAEEVLKNE